MSSGQQNTHSFLRRNLSGIWSESGLQAWGQCRACRVPILTTKDSFRVFPYLTWFLFLTLPHSLHSHIWWVLDYFKWVCESSTFRLFCRRKEEGQDCTIIMRQPGSFWILGCFFSSVPHYWFLALFPSSLSALLHNLQLSSHSGSPKKSNQIILGNGKSPVSIFIYLQVRLWVSGCDIGPACSFARAHCTKCSVSLQPLKGDIFFLCPPIFKGDIIPLSTQARQLFQEAS